ncbi:hypothetical protein V5O48_006081 [Marasmius crinis-equi]|uniref:F-box domain-containing protein n=1 Tax=Marasmius crinis-equi TaxID=585013 RepID=A0ABR3FLE6_9AGAR
MPAVHTCPQCSSLVNCSPPAINPIQPPSPATESLINTNDPPLDTFRVLIDNRTQAQTRLDFVNNEIARMEENIRVLSAERDLLGGFVATYKRVLHPIRRLPDDVLREIFWISLDHQNPDKEVYSGARQQNGEHDSLSPNKMPWKLGQVSRRWREVALSYPSLWSFVGIEFPDSYSMRGQSTGMGAQLFRQLRRSGTSMLSVHLRSTHDCDLQAFSLLLAAICSHSSRWQTLRVDLEIEQLHNLGALIGGEIPNLRRLYLERRISPAQLATIGMFSAAPKLHDITLPITNRLERLSVPWSQITHLRSMGSDGPFNRSFIRNSPHLISLFIRASTFDPTPAEVTLPSLRLLAIQVGGHGASTISDRLLRQINSSRLQDLRIFASNLQSSQLVIPSRLGQSLRSFCLGTRSLCTQDWTTVFKSMPGLEYLSLCEFLKDNPSWKDVLSDLGSRDPSSGRLQLLPRLRDIGLYAYKNFSLDGPSLLRLLETRFDQYDPDSDASTSANELQLQKVQIHPNVRLPKNVLQQLEVMASRGLQIDTSPKDWTDFFPGF